MDRRVVALGVAVLLVATAGCLGLGGSDSSTTDSIDSESTANDGAEVNETTDSDDSADDSDSDTDGEQLNETADDQSAENEIDGNEADGAEENGETEEERYAYGEPTTDPEGFDTQLPVDPPELDELEIERIEFTRELYGESDTSCDKNIIQMPTNHTFDEPTIVTFNFTIERSGGADIHATGEQHFYPGNRRLVGLFYGYSLMGPDWCTSYNAGVGPEVEALYLSVEKVEDDLKSHGYGTIYTWENDVYDQTIYDEKFHEELEPRNNIPLSSLRIGNETILPRIEMPRDPLVEN